MRRTMIWSVVGIAASFAVLTGTDPARADKTGAPDTPAATGQPTTTDQARVDPKADALLHKMSRDLAKLKGFRFEAHHATDFVTADGQKIQILASANVAVQRPNKLRSDRIGPVANISLYYDGKSLTIYGKRANLYAAAPVPDTLDAVVVYARDELGIDAPAADLLGTDAYAGLMEDVVSGTYVAKEPVNGRWCHHLAYRGHETDWQIWIADGPQALPCRYVITSKNEPQSPEYTIDMTDWKAEAIPARVFAFQPPPDAQRIEFLSVAQKREQLRQTMKEQHQERTP